MKMLSYISAIVTLIGYSALALPQNREAALPSFTWDGKNLLINFSNGKTDIAKLTLQPGFADDDEAMCIMSGRLEKEDVLVSVEGCPGDQSFQVVFDSVNALDKLFVVEDGVTHVVKQSKTEHDVDEEDVDDRMSQEDFIIILDDPELLEMMERKDKEVESRGAPSTMKVTISARYDKLFLENVANGKHNLAKNKVLSIINMAKPMFEWPTLGTKISLEVLDVEYVDATLILRGNQVSNTLKYAEQLSGKNPKTADNYHYFSYDNQGGTTGVARQMGFRKGGPATGTICWQDQSRRTGISEWLGSDLQTAMTFAHEMGHSLGIPHDFCTDAACTSTTQRKFGRPDSHGNPCWGDSIMDYYQENVNKWSTCSREKKDAWYDEVVKAQGKFCDGNYCMDHGCQYNPSICGQVEDYGGCNGGSASFFQKCCKKTCKKC